jgi:sugar phosphate isomerase/epimerase
MTWPVYVFDNYFSKSDLAGDRSAQAALLKRHGYGAVYHGIDRKSEAGWRTFLSWDEVARSAGLPMAAYYTVFEVDTKPSGEEHSVGEILDNLPSGAVLEMAIMWGAPGVVTVSDSAHDARVLDILRPMVEQAHDRGVTLSLYPHIWFWMERIEDCVRLAEQCNHPSLKVTFSSYHWYAVDGTALLEKMRLAAPWICGVNVCGSRAYAPGEVSPCGLPKTIAPVGEGDFPLDEFVRGLAETGFSGPVGFQGFGIGGHPSETLPKSAAGWRKAVQKLTGKE